MYDENEPLGRAIYFMAHDLAIFAEKILKPYALSLEQFHLLKCIVTCAGISQKDICSATSKTPANVTRLLDRLEKKALVERRRNLHDRRSYLVFATDEGLELVHRVVEIFNSFSAQLEKGISAAEQRTIRESFAKIKANLLQMDAGL